MAGPDTPARSNRHYSEDAIKILQMEARRLLNRGNQESAGVLLSDERDVPNLNNKIEEMSQEELDVNWEKMKAQLADLTKGEFSKFVDEGGPMIGLMEALVAEGIDLKTWRPENEK
jgi:hypothetical protein